MLLFIGFAITLGLTLGTPLSARAAEQDCRASYTVRSGDTLQKIARRCQTTVSDILAINPKITNPNRIYRGQIIKIPAPRQAQPQLVLSPESGPPGSEVRLEGEHFSPETKVRVSFHRAGQEPEEYRRVKTDVDGQLVIRIVAPESARQGETWIGTVEWDADGSKESVSSNRFTITRGPITYIVRRGDRLSKIAERFGVPLAAMLWKNPQLDDPDRIFTGQKLRIPAEGELEKARFDITETQKQVVRKINREIEPGARWIDVDLSTQTVRAYTGDALERKFVVSTGRARTPTVKGQYRIYVKHRAVDMRGPGYHLKDVPYTMYFHKGYGLHGTYWHDNFGTPMSHGCVNLSIDDAQWLFRFASVGTLVNVHD